MATKPQFASSAEAKKAGWFSRRHQTNAEHLAEQARYRARKAAKRG